jgi:uncharacterized membrane protein YdjX (TVP38/TMEM64 family)
MKFPKLSFSIIYGIYTGLMPLIMSGLVSIWVYGNINEIENLSAINLVLIWIGLSLAMGFSLIPTTFVAILAGFIWGVGSIIPLIVSYIFATIIGASLSKWIDNDQILSQISKNEKVKNVLLKLQNEQFKIVALARLSPVFPFGISNVVFTYLGVPLRLLLMAGIVGMLPRTIFMVWLASKAESIQKVFNTSWQAYLQSPIFIIGILSVFALFIVVYQAVKRK